MSEEIKDELVEGLDHHDCCCSGGCDEGCDEDCDCDCDDEDCDCE